MRGIKVGWKISCVPGNSPSQISPPPQSLLLLSASKRADVAERDIWLIKRPSSSARERRMWLVGVGSLTNTQLTSGSAPGTGAIIKASSL